MTTNNLPTEIDKDELIENAKKLKDFTNTGFKQSCAIIKSMQHLPLTLKQLKDFKVGSSLKQIIQQANKDSEDEDEKELRELAISFIAQAQERSDPDKQNGKGDSKASPKPAGSVEDKSQADMTSENAKQEKPIEEEKKTVEPEKVYDPNEFKNDGLDKLPNLQPVFRNAIVKNLVQFILLDFKGNKAQTEKWQKFSNKSAVFIEQELFNRFKSVMDDQQSYREEARNITSLIQMKANHALRMGLLKGTVNIKELLDKKQKFLDQKLQDKKKEQNRKFIDEADPEYENKFVKDSDMYQCEKCGSRKIIVTERQLKNNDPIKSFYDCSDCKYHWEDEN